MPGEEEPATVLALVPAELGRLARRAVNSGLVRPTRRVGLGAVLENPNGPGIGKRDRMPNLLSF
jgi:hypothetical protein